MNQAESNLGPGAVVTLRQITKSTLYDILRLKVSDEQRDFVASNAVSIAEAHFYDDAWFRAIYADETAVGFVMLLIDPNKAKYHIERFMIDSRFQGKGFGQRALALMVEHVKTLPNASELFTSIVDGEGGPEGFYLKNGFEHTGRIVDGERELKLGLANTRACLEHAQSSRHPNDVDAIQLAPMPAKDVQPYIDQLIPGYASDRSKADGISFADAQDEAVRQAGALLTEGVETFGHHFFNAVRGGSQERIGRAWIHTDPKTKLAYLHDILINEPNRRRGYGKKMICLLEHVAAQYNCDQLSLNAFAHNSGARALYESLGFETVALRMRKSVS